MVWYSKIYNILDNNINVIDFFLDEFDNKDIILVLKNDNNVIKTVRTLIDEFKNKNIYHHFLFDQILDNNIPNNGEEYIYIDLYI